MSSTSGILGAIIGGIIGYLDTGIVTFLTFGTTGKEIMILGAIVAIVGAALGYTLSSSPSDPSNQSVPQRTDKIEIPD